MRSSSVFIIVFTGLSLVLGIITSILTPINWSSGATWLALMPLFLAWCLTVVGIFTTVQIHEQPTRPDFDDDWGYFDSND